MGLVAPPIYVIPTRQQESDGSMVYYPAPSEKHFADPLDEATHEIERAAMRDTLILIGLAVALILKIVL
jgi:hypothetical protein